MSALEGHLADYLAVRRGLGFKLNNEQRMLANFVAFMESVGASTISVDLALRWAMMPTGVGQAYLAQRMRAVRGFSRYLHGIDPGTEIPPLELLPARKHRPTPHIYTEPEIAALMVAARALRPPLRAATMETLIGLLACTGLRDSEAFALDREDIDRANGLLRIRRSKLRREHSAHGPVAAEHPLHSGKRGGHWRIADPGALAGHDHRQRVRSLSGEMRLDRAASLPGLRARSLPSGARKRPVRERRERPEGEHGDAPNDHDQPAVVSRPCPQAPQGRGGCICPRPVRWTTVFDHVAHSGDRTLGRPPAHRAFAPSSGAACFRVAACAAAGVVLRSGHVARPAKRPCEVTNAHAGTIEERRR